MKPEPPSGFWRARGRSFACAARGVVLILRTQPNARIHLLATVLVVAAGLAFHVTRGEWLPLGFAIGIVWIAEAVNTALEVLADRITRERDEQIGRAKDLAAGAVLLAAITAAFIGMLVLGPYFWSLLRGHSG
ncbi:MAG: diacylglycerol kinase family protein [Chthoniobacteraceae bacterium]